MNKIYLNFWLFLLFQITISKTLIAQNYRNIPVHGNLYFIDSLNYIFPIDPDSIKFENGDSVIYHFKSIRPSKYVSTVQWVGTSYNLIGNSWAGSKTILKSNSTTIWFAKDADSILIRDQAKTGDIWLANRKRNTYGKVTNHVLKTFLGKTDSVKYLTIGSLNTLTSDVTGKEFWLSKNYGFIKMNDIYNFYSISISGIDNQYKYPYTGPVGNLTLLGSKLIPGTKTKLMERMVNDFNISDEFHINNSNGVYTSSCQELIENSILQNSIIESKTINQSMDTVTYKEILCGYNTHTERDGYHYTISTYIFNTTINKKLPYRDIGDVPLKSLKSLCINSDGLLQENLYGIYASYFCGNDTAVSVCALERIEANTPPCNNTIIEGMGYGYNNSVGYFNPGDPNPVCPDSWNFCLDYIKKGDKTWGSPHSFSCDTLIPRTILGINNAILQKSITIFPNPFSETLTIKSDWKIKTVNIFNVQMQLIKTVNISNQEVVLNLNELSSGLYIAEVILTDQRKAQYKIIKFD